MKLTKPLQLQEIQKTPKILIGLMLSHANTGDIFDNTCPKPEVHYIRYKEGYTPGTLEILELEDNTEQGQFTDIEYLDHHNTHWESERIRREYSAQLQHLSDNKYYAQIDNPVGIEYQIPEASYYSMHTKASRQHTPAKHSPS